MLHVVCGTSHHMAHVRERETEVRVSTLTFLHPLTASSLVSYASICTSIYMFIYMSPLPTRSHSPSPAYPPLPPRFPEAEHFAEPAGRAIHRQPDVRGDGQGGVPPRGAPADTPGKQHTYTRVYMNIGSVLKRLLPVQGKYRPINYGYRGLRRRFSLTGGFTGHLFQCCGVFFRS